MGAHEHHRTMLLTLTLLTLMHMGFVSSADDAATPVVAIVHAESAAAASSVDSTDDSSLFDLDRAESKDPGGIAPKLEIIKQIRRLNSDGSYTVGYEADDGTFKIESRDVLGNVKGTYGYVDVNGEIKRVSYTAGTNATTSSTSRTTGLKSAEDSPAPSSRNRTAAAAASSTTRRPAALAYLTTSSAQTSPTRATVIQAIPKKTRIAPSASSGGSSSERPTFNHHQHHHYASTPRHSNNELVSPSPTTRGIKVSGGEPTTTVVYATSVPTNRPIPPSSGLINIRPTPLPGTYKTVEQLMRPDKLEITDHVSKVQISSNRDTSTAKPVTELVDEKLPSPSASSSDSAEEKRTTRGSFVTRPTHQQDGHDEAVEAQQQVIYSQSAGDDSSHVYGGANPPGGTSRPVFAATPTTRIPSAVLAARSRAAQLQNAINQQQLAKQQQQQQLLQQQQNDKVYAKPPRRRPEAREDVGGDQTAGEPSSENQYVAAQRPATVQIVAPPASRELPDDEKRVYRRPVAFAQNVPQAYRSREFVRQAPAPSADYADYAAGPRQFRIPIPQAYPAQYQQPQPVLARPIYAEQQQVEDVEAPDQQQQYLRETTHMSARPAAAASTNEAEYPAYRPRGNGRQYLPYQPVAANSRAIADADPYDPYAPPPHHLHHAQHHNPYSPYHNRAPLPSQLFQHPDRPLTARDFERLLNLLVIRHQQLQRYQPGYNPYQQIPGPYHHPQQPGPYGYQQQIPRPPVYNPYDPRLSGLIRPPLYGEFSDQDAAFQTPSAPPGAEAQTRQQQARPTAKRPVYYSSERPEYSEASQPIGVQQQQQEPEYLPADIREELLYRMLLLAMQPSQSGAASEGAAAAALEQSEASSPEYASLGTTTSKPASLQAKFRKPVRSVQILGEE